MAKRFLAVLACLMLHWVPASSAPAAPGRAGDACGSRGLKECGPGLFCDFAPKAQCGAADLPGTCQARPEICPMIWAPVCGCGDKTYGNDCERQTAGVGKLHDGECR